MGTEVRITVYCDHAGCTQMMTGNARNEGGMNISTVLGWAKDEGWAVSGHKLKCPEHRQALCEFVGWQWFNEFIGTGNPKMFDSVRCSKRADHSGDHKHGQYTLVAEPDWRQAPREIPA